MISIIVLNYNDSKLTMEYVNTIKKYTCLDKIVVVDNCSPDGSYERLACLQDDKTDVIKTSGNKGYASGNNYGIKYILEKYGDEGIVIVSNPDIEVSQDAIEKILKSFDKIPQLFAATGEVHLLDGNRIPLFTWKVPTLAMLFFECSGIGKGFARKVLKISRRYNDINTIDYDDYYFGEALPGCFFAADIGKLKKLGLFSEKTFLYFEEDILFNKAKKIGYKVAVVKGAPIIHFEGVSTKKSISSWKNRELIMESSSEIYLTECLGVSNFTLSLYRLINYGFLPERYLVYRIKGLW